MSEPASGLVVFGGLGLFAAAAVLWTVMERVAARMLESSDSSGLWVVGLLAATAFCIFAGMLRLGLGMGTVRTQNTPQP